jgi:hypothetical protein
MLTTAGVIFLRTGASDGTLLLGGETGDGSESAARPAVAAARLNAIAANALIIIGLIEGGAGEQRRRKLEADRFGGFSSMRVTCRRSTTKALLLNGQTQPQLENSYPRSPLQCRTDACQQGANGSRTQRDNNIKEFLARRGHPRRPFAQGFGTPRWQLGVPLHYFSAHRQAHPRCRCIDKAGRHLPPDHWPPGRHQRTR